ncbi:MAG TPA: hypothetical protein VFX39_05395, partial [Gemmatimonadaceae bacterium]|nr:hypothetical protein [Gemmatimonadaceae bacterium]
FAVLLMLAILTKANGLLLLLVPPLSIAISGRWHVLRNRALWRAASVAAVLIVLGLWWSLPIMRAGWASSQALLGDVGAAAHYYLSRLLGRIGYVPIALVLVGGWARLRDRAPRADERVGGGGDGREDSREGAPSALWATAAAMVLATLLFHFAAPAGEDARHLLPTYPFLAMFMAAGVHALAGASRRVIRSPALSSVMSLAIGSAAVLHASLPIHDQHLLGFGPAAELVMTQHAARGAARDTVVSFVSSDPVGEGAMVVEMALRDRARPSNVVWRATKLLSTVTWAGRDYVQRPANEAELVRLLDLASVEWVVLDRSREPFPHQELLVSAIATYPERFALQGVVPVRRNGEMFPDGIRVYGFARDTTAPADSLLRQVPGYRGIE